LKKVIERKITVLSSNRGIEKMYNEFYSHDKNNAEFKFTLDKLTATKVICLFYFKTTKRYQEVEATIEGNSFTVQFDTSLITTDESVIGYIYFEKVEQSADVYSFMFNVHVSEIDKAVKRPLIERETGRIVNVKDVVTKQELDELFAKIKEQGGTYDDSDIRAKISHISTDIEVLKAKTDKDTVYDDSALRERVTALENKTDNDTVYNDTEIKQRLEVLEHKPSVNTSELVTKQELESKGYLTQHQSLSNYATKQEIPQPYNDAELKERVSRLENKTAIDTSNFVTNEVLNSKGYLTQHQSLEGYAKKSEIPQPYNDAEIKQRLATVEQKGENYATKEQLTSIPKTPQKLSIEGNTLILSDGGGNVTLPTATSSNNQANQYEIHGTGMPNGKVAAPVGTTYVDTAVTNNALKWIKRKGNDNQGWEVLSGDTGWRTLNIKSKLGNSYLKIRRKNDVVTYQFGGLSWGWFGVIRRGGVGYEAQGSDRERNCYILGLNGVPQGFRSEGSLIGNIYNDKGVPYGTWYLGGAGDSNMLRFQFTDPVPTDRDIGDIRVSSISYLTSEPWPGVLP
jgi:polyhydroxyalkanoate synthesis regulator phasin